MAHTTPRVEQGTLQPSPGTPGPLAVGTPAWFAWLADATIFAFVDEAGSFTARKERGGRDGGYWKAYRKRDGRLQRAYLGTVKKHVNNILGKLAVQSRTQAIARARDLQLL